MAVPLTKAFVLALAAVYAAGMLDVAVARDRTSDGDTFQGIMIEEGGKPAKKKKGAREVPRPRGSSYIPSTGLPQTVPPTVGQPSPGVYTPPPVNSFSDRVNSCNHSFPLNAGIGNNPTERNAYVRQCAN